MAKRPVFIPQGSGHASMVREQILEFKWFAGFATSQKQKSIEALHAEAARRHIAPVLEISSKSPSPLGRALSAFNLTISNRDFGLISLESAFQGSKVFDGGGPFTDLYEQPPVVAKGDDRLRQSGALSRFEWQGKSWPLAPHTAFYDWLYLRALMNLDDEVASELPTYAGFTDIEFNPKRSINCQARSCALYVSLVWRGVDFVVLQQPEQFLALFDSQERLF